MSPGTFRHFYRQTDRYVAFSSSLSVDKDAKQWGMFCREFGRQSESDFNEVRWRRRRRRRSLRGLYAEERMGQRIFN